MSSKKIYIIRHGQTDHNKSGILQGSGIDTELNEEGWRQASAFYENYKNVGFDKIYTSKLQRTHQSVSSFLEEGIAHGIYAELNEINYGIKEGEEVAHGPDSRYVQVVSSWKQGNLDDRIEGGESPLEVQERLKPLKEHIIRQEGENNILISTHGRAMKIFLSLLLDTPLSEMDQYAHSNLCLYLLDWDEGRFQINLKNDTTHLE